MTHFAYRSDREIAIRNMLQEAIKLAGVTGREIKKDEDSDSDAEPIVGVPEQTMVGESQSNGLAERAMQTIEGQIRCMKLALEDRLQCSVPCSHPIMAWLVEYASMLVNKYQPSGEDGLTCYERPHGQPPNERLPEFGETVLYFVPSKLRGNMDANFKFGIFLGRSWSSDQNFIGLSNGSVVRARGMARTTLANRWQQERAARIVAVPWDETPRGLDRLEEQPAPHAIHRPDDDHRDAEDDSRIVKRIKIIYDDIKRLGGTPHCPKCDLYNAGVTGQANKAKHSEHCRQRIYDLLIKSGSAKMKIGIAEGRATVHLRTRGQPAPSVPSGDPAPPTPVEFHEPNDENFVSLDGEDVFGPDSDLEDQTESSPSSTMTLNRSRMPLTSKIRLLPSMPFVTALTLPTLLMLCRS